MPNTIPELDRYSGVAARIAGRSLARRTADYETEVRRLLDAGLAVMLRCGTTSKPRVSDIVSEAGLSNDAFYRHFPSKDALVIALVEDGAQRLCGYLGHQMSRSSDPEAQVRSWVSGVLSQARGDVAAATLAVLWNGGGVGNGVATGQHLIRSPLASLLVEPFRDLGSGQPETVASMAAHAVFGLLSDMLWERREPAAEEMDVVADFWVAAVRAGHGRERTRRRRR